MAEGDRHRAVRAGQAPAQQGAQGQVAPAEVGGEDRDAPLFVDRPRDGDSGRQGRDAEAGAAFVRQIGGEVEDGGDHGVRAVFPPGRASCFEQHGAVLGEQRGFHAGAANIECDDVLHGGQFPSVRSKRSSPVVALVWSKGVSFVAEVCGVRHFARAAG